MAGVDSAIANVTPPPASCHACANAKQRIMCPVPIATDASARTKSISPLGFLTVALDP
jgi:hypothetical protein